MLEEIVLDPEAILDELSAHILFKKFFTPTAPHPQLTRFNYTTVNVIFGRTRALFYA